jgi:hypothetical protein
LAKSSILAAFVTFSQTLSRSQPHKTISD